MAVRKHVVEVRSIDGVTQYAISRWRRRHAESEARTWASPFYDVLIDGVVVHPHVPPADYLIRKLR